MQRVFVGCFLRCVTWILQIFLYNSCKFGKNLLPLHRNPKTIYMDSSNKTYLHASIYVAGAFVILHHVIRLVTNLIYLNVNFETGTIYNMVLGVLMIIIIILILMKNKFGVYAFFTLQLLNAIVISVWQGSWLIHLASSAFFSLVLAAVLCLKKDGVAGWVAIFGCKEDIENASSEKITSIESVQSPEIIQPNPEPTISLPVQETIVVHEERTPNNSNHRKMVYWVFAVVGIVLIGLAIYFVMPSKNKTVVQQQYTKEETIEKKSIIGKYIYVDKSMVLHTKNGCKAVFKDNSTQTVTPVEPQCLSNAHLAKVCSQCVSEEQIECLKDTFDKYRESYGRIGDLYIDLDSRYDGIPPILEFRMRMREYNYVHNIYEGLKEDGADVGTFEEFMNWIGLSKPVKRKTKTQL